MLYGNNWIVIVMFPQEISASKGFPWYIRLMYFGYQSILFDQMIKRMLGAWPWSVPNSLGDNHCLGSRNNYLNQRWPNLLIQVFSGLQRVQGSVASVWLRSNDSCDWLTTQNLIHMVIISIHLFIMRAFNVIKWQGFSLLSLLSLFDLAIIKLLCDLPLVISLLKFYSSWHATHTVRIWYWCNLCQERIKYDTLVSFLQFISSRTHIISLEIIYAIQLHFRMKSLSRYMNMVNDLVHESFSAHKFISN